MSIYDSTQQKFSFHAENYNEKMNNDRDMIEEIHICENSGCSNNLDNVTINNYNINDNDDNDDNDDDYDDNDDDNDDYDDYDKSDDDENDDDYLYKKLSSDYNTIEEILWKQNINSNADLTSRLTQIGLDERIIYEIMHIQQLYNFGFYHGQLLFRSEGTNYIEKICNKLPDIESKYHYIYGVRIGLLVMEILILPSNLTKDSTNDNINNDTNENCNEINEDYDGFDNEDDAYDLYDYICESNKMYGVDMLCAQLNFSEKYKKMRTYDDDDVNSFVENPKKKFTQDETDENLEKKAIKSIDSLNCFGEKEENTTKRRKFSIDPTERQNANEKIQHVIKNMSKRSRDSSEMNENLEHEYNNKPEIPTCNKRKRIEEIYNST